ncbi:MAG: hypothetical protein GKR97_03915 [Rhizobiaceae bacterium]|nr:hypothetical protein [Rhizobiaceae bacterium]
MSKKFMMPVAGALLIASTSQAISGNYSTGAQIGNTPTAAQQAYNDDQMRIRYQGDFLHESERRNGGKLVIAVTRSLLRKMRRSLRRRPVEWSQPTYEHEEPYH